MLQVIENSYEHDVIERSQAFDIVGVDLTDFDRQAFPHRHEPGLSKNIRHDVDTHYTLRASFLHLKAEISSVTADVEHGFAREVLRYKGLEKLPSAARMIADFRIRH